MVTAYRCRHNPEAFNETRLIAVTFYNSAVVGAATIGVLYAVTLSSYATTVLVCASLLVVAFTLVAVLFGPKFYHIYSSSPEYVADVQQWQHSQRSSHGQQAVRQAVKSQSQRSPSENRLKTTLSPYGSPSSAIGFRFIAVQSTTVAAADRTWMEAPIAIGGRSNSTTANTDMPTEGEETRKSQQQQQQSVHVRSPTSSSQSHRAIQLQPHKTASLVAASSSR